MAAAYPRPQSIIESRNAPSVVIESSTPATPEAIAVAGAEKAQLVAKLQSDAKAAEAQLAGVKPATPKKFDDLLACPVV